MNYAFGKKFMSNDGKNRKQHQFQVRIEASDL